MNQWSFCQFLQCQAPRRTAKPHFENFLATVIYRLTVNTMILHKWKTAFWYACLWDVC